MHRTGIGFVACALVALAACGSSEKQATEAVATSTTKATTTTTVAAEPAGTYGDAVDAAIALGHEPMDPGAPPGPLYLAADDDAVWVGMHRAHGVVRVDKETGALTNIAIDPASGSTKAVPLTSDGAGAGAGAVVAADDAVWVLDQSGFVWRIDPATNKIVGRAEVPGLLSESGAALGDGYLWVLTESGYARVDTKTNRLAGTFPLAGTAIGNGPRVATTPGAVWVGTAAGIEHVDAKSGARTATAAPGGSPVGADGGLVWGMAPNKVLAIDPETKRVVKEIPKPNDIAILQGDGVAVADGAVWSVAVPNTGPKNFYKLLRFDLATEKVTAFELMNRDLDFTIALATDDDAVWATDFGRGNLLHVPMR